MVIDFHSHIYPPHLAERVLLNGSKMGVTSSIDGTHDSLKQSMAHAGVTHSVILNIATRIGQTKNIVEFAQSIMQSEKNDQSGQTLIPFASVHPYEDGWREWLRKIKDMGFLGIKLHPDYQEFYVDDPRMEAFYKEIASLGLIMVFHAGVDVVSPNDVHASTKRIKNVLPLLEKCKTVLAHMGGHAVEEEVLELLCGHDIYFDNSYDFNKVDKDLAKKMFLKHTPDRILFGTDSPWCSQKLLLDYFRDDFAKGFLSKADTDRVLYKNASKLLEMT